MKNQKERIAFVNNPDNWKLFYSSDVVGLEVWELSYKDQQIYKLNIREYVLRFDYETCEQYRRSEWITDRYFRYVYDERTKQVAMEIMSLTDVRKWVEQLDREEEK